MVESRDYLHLQGIREEPLPSMSPQDFERLCRSIDQSVAQLVQGVVKGIDSAGDALGDAIGQAVEKHRQATAQGPAAPGPSAASTTPAPPPPTGRPVRPARPGTAPSTLARAQARERAAALKKRFRSPVGLTVSGTVMTALGGLGALGSAGAAALMLTGTLILGATPWALAMGAAGVATALCAWLTAAGARRLGIAQRARSYRRVFGEREVCTFRELAAQTQSTEKQARSSARRMLRHGLLPQGHIDDEGTCLMVTDGSYQLYRQAQGAQRQRALEQQAQARERARAQAAHGALPPEAQAFLDQGRSYLEQLRELDAAIDDKALSAQIARIEGLVGRILERVADEPSAVERLGRLTGYYLPTTVKLLAAYDELEEQPVQGENIASSRQEIEQTLAVLASAYEKLLDDTFRDLSLDVSSDIAVLHAMLAQEGLTDSPFDAPGAARPAADPADPDERTQP